MERPSIGVDQTVGKVKGSMTELIDDLVGLVPSALGTVVSIFASPILGGIAGPAADFVLQRLGRSKQTAQQSTRHSAEARRLLRFFAVMENFVERF